MAPGRIHWAADRMETVPMRPAKPDHSEQPDMFRETLEAILDPWHEVLQLGRRIDWAGLDAVCGETFVDQVGRPGLPTRLMAGLHILKHVKGLSDEAVCAAWVENPYFQAFCGARFFQHRLPLDRSSMTRWRQRIGAERLETLLADTLAIAQDSGAAKPSAMERVIVDTTVQTKAVAYPTDGHLMLRAIERLGTLARRQGVVLRQSFVRVARQARREAARLLHGRGHKQGMRHLRRLRTFLGRIIRDVTRKIAGDPVREAAFAEPLARAGRIRGQRPGDAGKLYAFHAPEVECIARGKARARYEFGVKTSFAVTNIRGAGGQFVLGARTLPGNPYDGHSLAGQLDQVARLTGRPVRRAYVDRGYRGHGLKRDGLEVVVSHSRGVVSPTIRREMRRRNSVEPVLGHMKADGLLERNRLLGPEGDAVNAILCAVGHNCRLLLAWFRRLLARLIASLLQRAALALSVFAYPRWAEAAAPQPAA
jgi:transposase, IS5 family